VPVLTQETQLTDHYLRTYSMVQEIIWKADCHSACQKCSAFFMEPEGSSPFHVSTPLDPIPSHPNPIRPIDPNFRLFLEKFLPLWRGPPSLVSNGYQGLLPGVKRPGREADRLLHLLLRSRMRRTIPPLPNTASWRGAQLQKKHRDNFTFIYYKFLKLY